jgi:hypothetical protein
MPIRTAHSCNLPVTTYRANAIWILPVTPMTVENLSIWLHIRKGIVGLLIQYAEEDMELESLRWIMSREILSPERGTLNDLTSMSQDCGKGSWDRYKKLLVASSPICKMLSHTGQIYYLVLEFMTAHLGLVQCACLVTIVKLFISTLEDAEPFWMDKIDDMSWRYMILTDTSGKVINLAHRAYHKPCLDSHKFQY